MDGRSSLERIVDATIEQATQGVSFAALASTFKPAFAEAGFIYFAEAEVREDGEAITSEFRHGIFDLALIAYGQEHGFASRDPGRRMSIVTGGPVFWSDLRLSELSAAERRMLDECGEWGLHQMFVLARPRSNAKSAVVFVGSSEKTDPDPVTRRSMARLARCYGDCVERLDRTRRPTPSTLSERQIECLRWARVGKSASEIAEILGISPRTVEEHFTLACRKLNVRGRVSAVAKAITLGILR
jgi:DNA-binding CsgD family transcriptional regulator